MGAWAEGPFDNDTGLDFLGDILQKVEDAADLDSDEFDEWQYDTVRAAVEVFMSIGPDKWSQMGNYATKLRDKLDIILKDEDWLKSWKDKEPVILSITSQREKLDKIIKEIEHPEL